MKGKIVKYAESFTIIILLLSYVGCERNNEPYMSDDNVEIDSLEISDDDRTEEEVLPPLRDDVRVNYIFFGSEIDKYNNPKTRLKEFLENSQIYVAVLTDGNGPEVKIRLVVRNSSGNNIYDSTQVHVPNGSWSSAFNLQPNLSEGEYVAQAFLDGHMVKEASFKVLAMNGN
ncbi:MAG TPA: hypothetical protein PKA63_07330 [Oligoflexia bacterium]|nr:hypothetical protein [Oligoflexia bacterium]HMP48461.1 hypothetical protein [Oligoflexia bacterium]